MSPDADVEDYCILVCQEEVQCDRGFQCDNCGAEVEAEKPVEWLRTCPACGCKYRVRPFTEEVDPESEERKLRAREVSRRCGGLTNSELKELND